MLKTLFLRKLKFWLRKKDLDHVTEQEILEAIEIFEKNQPTTIIENKPVERSSITTYFSQLDGASTIIENFTIRFNEDGWTYRKTVNDIQIWTKRMESMYHFCIKGVGTIQASPSEIINFVSVPTNIPIYDSMCESGEVIKTLDKQTHICHLKFSTRVCILKQARDFVLARHKYKKQDGTMILVATSIDYPDIPPNKNYLRGQIFCGGFVAVPKGENVSEVSYVSYFDIIDIPFESEWIKVNFIERLYEKQPLNIHYLRRHLSSLKNDKKK